MKTLLELPDLIRNFPRSYPKMLPNQRTALAFIAKSNGRAVLELPTGSGKTANGFTFLKTLAEQGKGPLFYAVPTKTLVGQVAELHPEVAIAEGRNAHRCLYYRGEGLNADQVPCSLLGDCAHRVDQETGKTHEQGATPCPYLLQKFQAKQSQIVVCTAAFYLFTQLMSREWEKPEGLVLDEVHRLPSILRSALSFEITDWHLDRSVEILQGIGADKEAEGVRQFRFAMLRTMRRKPAGEPTLLTNEEVEALLARLDKIDPEQKLQGKITKAIKSKEIDPVTHRGTLQQLETLTRNLRRYVSALEYALPTEDRGPLNYTYAFYTTEKGEGDKVQYRLVVKSYYVAPLIKRLLAPMTVAYSATIGDPKIFGFETGIKMPLLTLPSDFPAEHTRIFMPTDTPNLSAKYKGKREPTQVLRKIAIACRRFAEKGHRSLVIVVSNRERQKFLDLAKEEGVEVVTYQEGLSAREAAIAFKEGFGDVLLGTSMNYGEGVDLPKSIAPVIFFLRPSYPPPNDPAVQFESRRFGKGNSWRLWNWRVMIEALQVRGRNVRSAEDLGVTFLVSQQFRRFAHASLPEWLKPSYRGEMTFEECIKETRGLLK